MLNEHGQAFGQLKDEFFFFGGHKNELCEYLVCLCYCHGIIELILVEYHALTMYLDPDRVFWLPLFNNALRISDSAN